MLKTYRIIPLVFILFLFGFTLITVAPVFAWDKSMGMRHPDRPCMKNAREKGPRFGCGRDMRSPELIKSDPYDTNNPMSQEARANQADSPEQMSTSPSGGEVDQLNARIAELEAENATLKGGGTPDTHAHTAMKKLVNAGLEGCKILANKCKMLNIKNNENDFIIDQRRRKDMESWHKENQAKKVCRPDPNYDGKRFCRANPDARSYQECVGSCKSQNPLGLGAQ